MNRRGFLTGTGAGIALLAARPALAGTTKQMNWQPAYMNAPAAGYGPTGLKAIHGKLPAGFKGSLYRNGPAWFSYGDDTLDHWFDGDGMIHRVAFEDGNAVHSGKFVNTTKHKDEQAAGRFLAPGFGTAGDPSYQVASADDANSANTSVMMIGDDLMALWEGGSPVALDPLTLETRGVHTWRDDLAGMPFLAHPKVDREGRIWNLGMGGKNAVIYRISPAGQLEDFGMVDMGAPAYIHDFAMTEKSIVLLVQPWLYTRSIPPFVNSLEWLPERGLEVMIISKDDYTDIRRAQLPARGFFHTGDAWEDADGTVHVDLCTTPDMTFGKDGEKGVIAGVFNPNSHPSPQLAMISIPRSGAPRLFETGQSAEFPRTDPRYQGVARRHVWMVDTSTRKTAPGSSKIRHQDWESGIHTLFDYGSEHMVEEHVFVADPARSGEGEGWLVGTTFNMAAQATEVHILDALNIKAGPVASYRAPYAWPIGFHGNFVAA